MAYSELIKSFNRTRGYMRQFYVYGFKSRDEYSIKSARSYDDERRRVESWLGEYMRFRRMPNGKNTFISIDSRAVSRNPLFRAWQAKSFTDGDITLHFLFLDILSAGRALTLSEIMDAIGDRLSVFDEPRAFDESTVRKKLGEYVREGLVTVEKQGRASLYRLADKIDAPAGLAPACRFFSEVLPCGVLGAFIGGGPEEGGDFRFKHHNIGFAMDEEIACALLLAMREKRSVTLRLSTRGGNADERDAVPVKLLRGVQSGRQYLMAYSPRSGGIHAYRLDSIISVTPGETSERFDLCREQFRAMRGHLWGVATKPKGSRGPERVSFTVRFEPWEQHIPRRLEREKRCGTVERLDLTHCRFSAEVYDASELIPWIRSFICRITELSISDKRLETRFKEDLKAMYALYGLGGESG